MTYVSPNTNARAISALAAILVQALIVYALIAGLAVHFGTVQSAAMKLFNVAPPPPPPPPDATPPRHPLRAPAPGAPSPPNLRSTATPVVAPTPIVRLDLLPPVVAAPRPASGADATSGAAAIAGPGTGSGGAGNGQGGGGNGDGDGDETPPRWRHGDLSNADFPAAVLARAGDFHGTVSVQYVVTVNGRVTQCSVTRSSGDRNVDGTTCRLIEKRFRFDPSRDAAGRPVPAMIVENHEWDIEHDRPAPRS